MALAALTVAGCGGKTSLFSQKSTRPSSSGGGVRTVTVTVPSPSGHASGGQTLGFPEVATKNTTRVDGSSPAQNAAAVALSVFPSTAPGTHPTAVTLAPTDDWPAAIAARSLMAGPFRAPVLLSTPGNLPAPTSRALTLLAPTGASSIGGAQVIRIGDAPAPAGLKATDISGSDPYALAAAIDAFEAKARGRASLNVVVTSATDAAYAMPAAGYAAESGEPVLFVNSSGVPGPTVRALTTHHHPHIYVLGPPSVIPAAVLGQLAHYGVVKRIGAADPAANSVAFASYRDPACPAGQPCVHVPGSFGWAIQSPGHAYVLMSDSDPLNAAAASALSSSGGYGPQLLVEDPNTLPKAVLNYFLDYATPGYNQEGPTAAVFNHGWLIGDAGQISLAVQAQVDSLLEVVAEK